MLAGDEMADGRVFMHPAQRADIFAYRLHFKTLQKLTTKGPENFGVLLSAFLFSGNLLILLS